MDKLRYETRYVPRNTQSSMDWLLHDTATATQKKKGITIPSEQSAF